MRNITVGIVDYGMGNHASVVHSLRNIGFRTRVSSDPIVLDAVDVLLIPGVGAFPLAMEALIQRNLVTYLKKQAENHRPIIGICLGMQLLATESYEFKRTLGLDIIPGKIVALKNMKLHIGWNTLDCIATKFLQGCKTDQNFYFNHSFCYEGPDEHKLCMTKYQESFASVIGKNKVIGVQFHPEKSQMAGQELLRTLILRLTSHA